MYREVKVHESLQEGLGKKSDQVRAEICLNTASNLTVALNK